MRPSRPHFAAVLALLSGCYLSHGPDRPADAGPDTAMDTAPDVVVDVGVDTAVDAPRDVPVDAGPRPCRIRSPVDLLLVVDDSRSMREEQGTLARELPSLVSELVDPPDLNGDGERDWRPVTDLHLGVVTTGVAGPVGCDGDGVLRTFSGTPDPECDDSYPPFLTYNPGDDVEAVSGSYGCLARVGARGCPVEQPLEAAIKALLPAGADLDFVEGTAHGDTANAGFLREDSLLAVLVLTDEDDCSFYDPNLFFAERDLPACMNEDDELFPLDRYEASFRSLRPDRPDLFVFAAIAGIPVILASESGAVGYDAVLADPAMQYRVTFRDLPGVACESTRGNATPARRLVTLAQRFGAQSVVGSICQGDYSRVIGAMARLVINRACEEFE